MQVITLKEIENSKRLDFLPEFFGHHTAMWEQTMYANASESLSIGTEKEMKKYNGGYWKFYRASIETTVEGEENTIQSFPLMVLDIKTDKKVSLRSSFEELDTNILTACVAMSLVLLNHMTWHFNEKCDEVSARKYNEMFFGLKSWIYHDENTFLDKEKDTPIIYSYAD